MDFSRFTYAPILEVRLAEMTAMEEARPADKDMMLPYIILRPWLTARHVDAPLARVQAAIGHRPTIIDLTDQPFDTGDGRRPVHDAFDELRDPSGGYRNYLNFIEQNENFIPSLQLGNPSEVPAEVSSIAALGRGVAVRLTEHGFGASRALAEVLRKVEPSKVLFVIDYETQTRELLARALGAIEVIEGIRSVLPDGFISVSASTFPSSFVGITHRDIFERRFFHEVIRSVGAARMIYSDHGSARIERQLGGGGSPAPRIDNALPMEWCFFRDTNENMDREERYCRAAKKAVASPTWSNLGIWGTREIIRTANGDGAIGSAQKSTAVRINIHLHQQANFGGPADTSDVETDWSD